MIPETSPEARYNHLPPEVRSELRRAAKEHIVTVRSLLTQSHRRNVVAARLQVMRWLRTRGYSYPQIGLVFGQHHSTVFYALKIDRRKHPDPVKEPAPFPDYSGEWAI